MADEDSESVRTAESQELSALPLPQLEALVQETSHALSIFKVETEMFEKYYNKMEPKDLVSHLLPDIYGSSLDLGQTRTRRKSKSRATADRFIGLTVEQKNDLAQRELDETKEEIQRTKGDSERIIQNYQAVMEEADIRWADIKKAMCNFNKDIIQTISKKKGSVIASEKVLRYLEEKNHYRDAMKEKLRLKNDSLKVQKKKLQLQLKQKEEMGEALHEVDFQQLKIENAQFLEKIDERNRDLLQLKLTAGNTLQILNSYKRKLQNTTATSARLMKDISQRKEALEKMERETILVEEVVGTSETIHTGNERAKAESVNKQLRQQLSDYRVPPVVKYVNQKMAIYDLENNIKIWERKVEIAEMSLQSYRRAWNKVKMVSNQLQLCLPLQGGQ
ncbi:coiled-coil domain-containing protein 113 isoform X1 [Malaclemys terrapin pileata]|uniref:coiled-coil domain-containing protein 113 isoform X1 n=1 Tax=Malaclemys terrapin pileata TaxID=2991368 RepID=UPI0023A829FD|nr:coiled-coil domain-containing protein 113 isoform X1 [Malaclemys terrapin pileata]